MKRKILAIAILILAITQTCAQEKMNRIDAAKENYRILFGGKALTGQGNDPEMMDILQKFIFGEVFQTGNLDIKTREMITCITLAAMQTFPQLKVHIAAVLNVGVIPIEIRELIYMCAPFIGFPPSMKALRIIADTKEPNAIAEKQKVRLSRIVVDSIRLDEYNVYLKEEVEASMALESGVLTLYATAEKERPNHITILEIYASEDAYKSHIQTPHFVKYKEGTLDMVQQLELIDTNPLIEGLKIK